MKFMILVKSNPHLGSRSDEMSAAQMKDSRFCRNNQLA